MLRPSGISRTSFEATSESAAERMSNVPHELKKAAHDDFEAGSGMRANLQELLTSRRGAIDELKSTVGEAVLSQSPEYDDVFLLRFVLTWEKRGGIKESVGAVRDTIKWRQENKALLDKVWQDESAIPHDEICRKFQTLGHGGSLGGLEPVFIVRTGHSNIKGLMQTLTVQQVSDWLHFTKERNYRLCDERTRKTGTLIKTITVVDMDQFSMFAGDRAFYKALGDSSKRAAINYPQLLGKSVLINTPSFMRYLWSSFSIFMPQTFIDKMTVCPATNTTKGAQSASVCPFVKKFCGSDLSTLPDIFGGTMPTPQHLQPRHGLQSDLIKVQLANRSTTSIEITVPMDGLKAKWEVIVENFGIGMRAVLSPDDGSGPIQVMEDTKIKAEGGLAQGALVLPKKGILTITFDNSYSILRSKTFEYKIKLDEDALGFGKPASNTQQQVESVTEKMRTVVHM